MYAVKAWGILMAELLALLSRNSKINLHIDCTLARLILD